MFGGCAEVLLILFVLWIVYVIRERRRKAAERDLTAEEGVAVEAHTKAAEDLQREIKRQEFLAWCDMVVRDRRIRRGDPNWRGDDER